MNSNSIKNAALELWEDLRARRLLPVAAALLVGLIAAPILLSKKPEQPATPASTAAADTGQSTKSKGPEALAAVKLEQLTTGSGSSLSAFDESNPFAPPQKVIEAARREAEGDSGAATAPDTTGTGTTGTTGGTSGGGTSGDTTETPGSGGEGGTTKTQEFTYVIDVTLWSDSGRRQIKGLQKLEVLPNEASPLLIFVGVGDDAGNAVFLVDSTIDASGEGSCKPSRADCAYLYLGAGSEEQFTNDDGDSFRLRIDEIRKVEVGDESDSTAAKKSKSARASAAAAPRRFVPPVLTDLVVESTEGGDNSTGDEERR